MSDVAVVAVGYDAVIQKMQTNDTTALEDIMDIEAAMLQIKIHEARNEHYKALKKKRAEAIEKQIAKNEAQVNILKSIIKDTLSHHKQTKIHFPGVGSVNQRKNPGKWTIVDEDNLMKTLEKEGELEAVTKPDLIKSKLNKLLDVWQSSGKLPDSVKKEDDEVGVTIKFEDIDENKLADFEKQVSQASTKSDDFDSLSF